MLVAHISKHPTSVSLSTFFNGGFGRGFAQGVEENSKRTDQHSESRLRSEFGCVGAGDVKKAAAPCE